MSMLLLSNHVYLPLILLNKVCSAVGKSAEPDQLASADTIWSGSTLFVLSISLWIWSKNLHNIGQQSARYNSVEFYCSAHMSPWSLIVTENCSKLWGTFTGSWKYHNITKFWGTCLPEAIQQKKEKRSFSSSKGEGNFCISLFSRTRVK